jgi:hypothetical protein
MFLQIYIDAYDIYYTVWDNLDQYVTLKLQPVYNY